MRFGHFILLALACSPVHADEFVGRSASGQSFVFVMPDSAELSQPNAEGLQVGPLDVYSYKKVKHYRHKLPKNCRIWIPVESEIVVGAERIECGSAPLSPLSGVTYELDRTIDRKKELSTLRCKKGCSNLVPTVLRFEQEERGC
jgi:hypothetical protein